MLYNGTDMIIHLLYKDGKCVATLLAPIPYDSIQLSTQFFLVRSRDRLPDSDIIIQPMDFRHDTED